MVNIPEHIVLSLAKQGDVKAISVWLAQLLASKGVRIKLKHKGDCLQILLQIQKTTNQRQLIQLVQQQIVLLNQPKFATVKFYQPQAGKEQAILIHTFELPSLIQPTARPQKPDRYSVAEFLAQITSIEDLQLLQAHPFLTSKCPQCGHGFEQLDSLPVYWDCNNCGWTDDLKEVILKSQNGDQVFQTTQEEMKRLGTYLVEAGLLSEDHIKVALADQQLMGIRLGEALVKRGWIKEETIEYLMEKVVLPERSASLNISYLELSRKLVQTILTQQSTSPQENELQNARNSLEALMNDFNPAQANYTLMQSNEQNPVNRRETLILPDRDASDFLDDTYS